MSRAPIVFPVRFSAGVLAVQTTTREVSLEGVFVRCLNPPATGTSVSLKLYLPGTPQADGAVATVREVNGAMPDAGFWAEFTDLPAATRDHIAGLLERRAKAQAQGPGTPIGTMALPGRMGRPTPLPVPGNLRPVTGSSRPITGSMPEINAPLAAGDADARRVYPRFRARFKVRFTDVQQFVLEYAANISAGGVFVQTDHPPALNTVVAVMMELPGGGEPAEAKGVVVHRVTPEEAATRGGTAGMGVQFLDADDAFRERIDRAIEVILKSESA